MSDIRNEAEAKPNATSKPPLDPHLKALENEAIHIFREVAAEFERPVMLYSIGKDSSVLLHLARKAFYPGRVPFPLLHVNTGWKFAEMITFRDNIVKEYDLDLIEHVNPRGAAENVTPFSHGSALYTDIIAAQMGLSESRRRWLKRGALLHDVGKLGVSNAILDKPDKLNAQEWAAVQMHAAYTEEILGRIGAFRELAQVAGAHHERLDGKGYPRGLSGAEIALETRIITTADIFDAITAKRPYRDAIPVLQALEMMAEHLGSAIDPDCFAALQAGIRDFSLYLSPEQPLAQAG